MKKNILLFFICIFSFSLSFGQIINTYAGNGICGNSGDGGPATSAEICTVFGIAYDNSGNLYISGSTLVRKVNSLGSISTFAGNGFYGSSGNGGPATSAELESPYYVAVDDSFNVYISDYGTCNIRKVNTLGLISTIAGNGVKGYSGDGGQATNAALWDPLGIAVDNFHNLFIADYGNSRIREVKTNGIITTIAGNGVGGYSGDGGNATNAEINLSGAVYVDGTGNIYISDANNQCVRKVNTSGIILTIAGNGSGGYSGDGGPATVAEFNGPVYTIVDGQGNLYISDQGNDCVRFINTSGIISTIAGNGTAGYSGDGGMATSAELNFPEGLALDATGDLYIAEYLNYRVRIISGNINTMNNYLHSDDLKFIFPNPSSGTFTLQTIGTQNFVSATIEIYNVLGEKV